MSGHSRWAQIKHKKAGADVKRGALFSKLARLITIAARDGGPDPAANPKLRQAMISARAAGVPKDNIERAIERAEKGADVENLKFVEYEAYGPGGSAFLIAGLTDNTNRTTNEIKHLLDVHGGRLANAGSVAWLFDKKIVFEFPVAPDRELLLIDAGAEDTETDGGIIRVLLDPTRSGSFQEKTSAMGLEPIRSVFAAIPKTLVILPVEDRAKARVLAETLEDHDDIHDVWTNIAPE